MIFCIAIGLIANVIVAWALVSQPATISFDPGVSLNDDEARLIWRRYVRRDEEPRDLEGRLLQKRGITEIFVFPAAESAKPSNDGETDWVAEWQSGWPLRALRTGCDFGVPDRQFKFALHNPKPFELLGIKFGEHLPIRAIWPGLIINTVFYAGVVWMLIRGLFETRRRWRELKDRCGACGAVRTDARNCAGCGADLTRAWFQRVRNGVASDAAK